MRTIPIHPDLLPTYQRRLEATEDGYLFAGKQDKAGKRLNAVQQRFTKLKREQKFTDLHVFHSFRGTVITQLEQAGVSPLAITSIVGHKRGSITFDVYSAGASLRQKLEAISLLSFDF
ncbi:tyrosine-type recombinase/integrase [Pseudomonas anguilliseptica]|uniref:tyrosine-type recombinase/integrase n=1 Tax=Pseudomonas anguilliseptica TaxID=53406 RepID=UPI000B87A79C